VRSPEWAFIKRPAEPRGTQVVERLCKLSNDDAEMARSARDDYSLAVQPAAELPS